MHELVKSYLVHYGYIETLQSIEEDSGGAEKEEIKGEEKNGDVMMMGLDDDASGLHQTHQGSASSKPEEEGSVGWCRP